MWEQERGLPVRRLPGGRGRVCTTTAELDSWKRSGPLLPGHPETEVADPPRVRLVSVLHWTAAAGLLLALAGLAMHFRAGAPATLRLERDTLIALDDAGRECWRKILPFTPAESLFPERAAQHTWIGDLDGDGHTEVLFAPHRMDAPTESAALICYSDRGVERWRYANRRRVRTRSQQFAATYGIIRYLVTPLGKGQGNAILLSSTHSPYYPCQVVLLSPRGKVLREYWHSGHLSFMQSLDSDGDGRNEFYLAGINNARHAATLVVLDQDHFGGAAREPDDPDHQLLDFGPGSERARIILPRSCLNTAADPYNPVATFTADAHEIVVQTEELIGVGAGIFHHFSPDLSQHRIVLSDSYRVAYQQAVREGRIARQASCTP